MASWPKKDARYKLLSKSPRKYRDMLTGELLSRAQFEERTRGKSSGKMVQPLRVTATTTPQPRGSRQKPVATTVFSGRKPLSGSVVVSGSGPVVAPVSGSSGSVVAENEPLEYPVVDMPPDTAARSIEERPD